MVLRRRSLGNPSPNHFMSLYKAIAEPAFVYAAESCVGAKAWLWKRVDDLQVKAARFALGVPQTSNRLLVVTDLGELPASDRAVNLALKFLVYALQLPPGRLVRVAVMGSMDLARAGSSSSWFSALR
ncbi:hypothetical protein DFH27DRAFT_480735, partial [Peziza echinospora]